MATSIVVKVRYGETLRRFNANLNEAGRLELDIGGLREKVLGLFSLAPNSDITITYIDEDGDVVTLVDEEDLRDVITQSLNPLRLTVKCNAENVSGSHVRSSGNSTPLRSPRVQLPLENLNKNVSEMLKSVPEPFREPISKLSLDLASKATTRIPGLSDLAEALAKMDCSRVDLSKSGNMNVTSGSGSAGSQAKVPGALETKPEMKFEKPSTKANQKEDIVKGDKGIVTDAPASPPPLNASSALTFLPWLPVDVKNIASPPNVEAGKSVNPMAENIKDAKKSGKEWSYFTPGVYPACAGKDRVVDSGTSSVGGNTPFPDLNLVNECPFTGLQVEKDSAVFGPPRFQPQFGTRVHPFKRSYNNNDGLGSIFHRGVRCDGCGVHPITGPRFKSKVKEDYDLCSVCFSQMGNAMDYIRMDRPASYHHPHSFKGSHEPCARFRVPTLQHVVRGAGLKPSRPKLDSRFVKDVNVMDGTMMAPSTPFTKIWRMKNSGTIVWPRGSQLVYIGGDQLSDLKNVELQIQSDEVAVDSELDVAVDFTAPKKPGRYISYWRMASPSGQKFGQRVWVLIQVDTSLEDSLLDSFQGLNLNLPPQGSNEAGTEYHNPKSESVLVEPANVNRENELVESLLVASSDRATELVEPLIGTSAGSTSESVEPLVGAAGSENGRPPFPIFDSPLFGGVLSSAPPAKAEAPIAVGYPVVDSSAVEQPESPKVASSANEVPVTVEGGSSDLEQSLPRLLRELDDMGFKQADLNKEILRTNGYDLELAVDQLCGFAEWDPMLEELKEMGFNDTEVNKRLLKKNNGSIKGVVMDLITGEKYD